MVDFMTFVKHVYDGFIEGRHHKQVAKKFEQLSKNPGSRIIVNMPPRHTKSEFASYLLPAWLIGKNPATIDYLNSNSGHINRLMKFLIFLVMSKTLKNLPLPY